MGTLAPAEEDQRQTIPRLERTCSIAFAAIAHRKVSHWGKVLSTWCTEAMEEVLKMVSADQLLDSDLFYEVFPSAVLDSISKRTPPSDIMEYLVRSKHLMCIFWHGALAFEGSLREERFHEKLQYLRELLVAIDSFS